MSSFSGTTNGQADAGLQLAPVGNDGPDHALLSKTFSNTLANLQGFFDQCEENFNTRYALWSGQSADGKKHAREGAKIDPTPWDGASDLQVFLTDEAIIKKVAMLSMAFRRAGISATPVEGNEGMQHPCERLGQCRRAVSQAGRFCNRGTLWFGHYVHHPILAFQCCRLPHKPPVEP